MFRVIFFINILFVILYSCETDKEIIKDCDQLKALGIDDSYTYPVRPGMSEWNFTNQIERLNAVQVPEGILENMCTHGLVETCINCPIFPDLMAWNNMKLGFEYFVRNINSFHELTNRVDASIELKNKYMLMIPDSINKNWTSFKRGEFKASFYLFEIFISQEVYLIKFTENQLNDLLLIAYYKLADKEKNKFGYVSSKVSVYLFGNILYYHIDFAPAIKYINNNQEVRYFIDSFRPITYQAIDSLKYYTNLYLSTIN